MLTGRLAPYPLRCRVTANNVNYRRGPGTQYASFGQLNRGFRFASGGGVPSSRSRRQYWETVRRPGHADAWAYWSSLAAGVVSRKRLPCS